MKSKLLPIIVLALATFTATAATSTSISGDYVEARTCNVYAGSCFVNGEMGLTGKEAVLVWSVREGSWRGANLSGLNVVAVIGAQETLGDQQLKPCAAKAVLIVDERANAKQKSALADLARTLSGQLTSEVVDIKTASMDVKFPRASSSDKVSVKAGNLVEISTSNVTGHKAPCGYAEIYYPPLTAIHNPLVGFTDIAAYRGTDLDRQWESTNLASAYYGTFSK